MEKAENGNLLLMVVKGIGIALICNLIGILVFGFVVKLSMLGDSVIKAVNQFIKVISVFLGCFFSVKGSLGFLKGGLIGIFSNFAVYLVFAIISGAQLFSSSFFIDLLFLLVIGIISGIITVNFRKN